MAGREKEYLRIFIAESLEEYEQISKHVVELEQDPGSQELLNEIFRLLHNLKANANAMGYSSIGDLAHRLENAFTSLKSGTFSFEGDVVQVILDGLDLLGQKISNIDRPLEKEDVQEDEQILERINALLDGKDISSSVPQKRYYTPQNIDLSELVSIEVKKLDDLLNLVGELIIDRDRIESIAKRSGMEELKLTSNHLNRITNYIQQSVMDARLVNVGTLFNKFPRIVRDISVTEGKKVNLELSGQDIKIDRNILQIITDSMLHLVRNAINHGIESREERQKAGKKPVGTLSIASYSDKDTVVISIRDDGRGIDFDKVKNKAAERGLISQEKAQHISDDESLAYLFEPGFSMARSVNEISGRGVGLDVVKSALDSIGGTVVINSVPGEGTEFRLSLPTSIAMKTALLFEVNNNKYGIPLIHIDTVLHLPNEKIHQVGELLFADVGDESIPVVYLSEYFSEGRNISGRLSISRELLNVVIISHNNRKTGLIVDSLVRQQEIVVKPLQSSLNQNELFGGVTLLGTGDVCLVMDVPAAIRIFNRKYQQATA